MREGKIGETEAIVLLTTVMTGKIFITFPNTIVSYGGNVSWLIILLSGCLALILFSFILRFLSKFGGNSFPESAENIAGPYLGTIIVLAVLLPWLIDVAMTLRKFSEMMVIIALPETPISVMAITFITASSIAAYLGVNTIARAAYLSFPLSLGAVLFIIILTYPAWNLDWLFPLLGKGLDHVIKYGILRSSDYGELNLLYAIPLIFYSQQIKRIGYKSIVLTMLIFLIVIITYLLTFPAVVGEEPYLPLYMMARGVYLGRFLQRIEAVFVLFWVINGYLWISTGIYGFSRILCDLLRLPDYRPLILPTGILIFAISFIPANLPDVVLLSVYTYREYSFISAFGIPALLLMIAHLRRKGVPAENEAK